MKLISVIALFCLCLSADGKFAIQVMSVENNKSITPEFIQKLESTGLPYVQEKVDGMHTVYLGKFQTQEEADSALDDVKSMIADDAFVCQNAGAVAISAQQKMQQAMLMAKARTLKRMLKTEEQIEVKSLVRAEPIKMKKTEVFVEPKVVITKKDTKQIRAMKDEINIEEIYCKDTKQALRETEIAEAIAFYANSSFYSFQGDGF